MEVANRRQTQAAYSSATRMYSPTRGSSAYAYAQEAAAPKPQPKPQPAPQPSPRPKQSQRRELSLGCRWAMLCTLLLLAGASLTVVFRYADIAVQYAQVNQLKSDIESAKLRVRELNVTLECSVSIQQAQEAARRFGMTYPTASQYVRAGDALVLHTQGSASPDSGDNAFEPEGA